MNSNSITTEFHHFNSVSLFLSVHSRRIVDPYLNFITYLLASLHPKYTYAIYALPISSLTRPCFLYFFHLITMNLLSTQFPSILSYSQKANFPEQCLSSIIAWRLIRYRQAACQFLGKNLGFLHPLESCSTSHSFVISILEYTRFPSNVYYLCTNWYHMRTITYR